MEKICDQCREGRFFMGKYTLETKTWLDQRFKRYDVQGIYYAHQPIYGFRRSPSEPGHIRRYIRTYQIMKALASLEFKTLLDVGGAEGYTAWVAKELFGLRVVSPDLSEEACKRASEIFNIRAIPADIHSLPFKNSEFDVVLCSETLEHVADFQKAVSELLRVAKSAVVITVPHESEEVVSSNIEEGAPHGHIRHFDSKSFDFLKSQGYVVFSRKMINPLVRFAALVVEAMPREDQGDVTPPPRLVTLYNKTTKYFRKLFGVRTAVSLVVVDEYLCRFLPFYGAALFMILKDSRGYRGIELKKISPSWIIDKRVPYHYIKEAL